MEMSLILIQKKRIFQRIEEELAIESIHSSTYVFISLFSLFTFIHIIIFPIKHIIRYHTCITHVR